MKFDTKIEQMLADGKLTPDQAAALNRSLCGVGTAISPGLHKTCPSSILIAGGVIAGVVIISIAMAGGAPPAAQEIQNVSEILNQSGKVGEMNKSLMIFLSVAIIGIPVLLWIVLGYNGLVTKEENVLSSWAQVESNRQRRADLIPNLVDTVKAFAEHEAETLTDITKLREQAESVQKESAKANEMSQGSVTRLEDDAYMADLAAVQQGLSKQLKSLMVEVEAYPALRSSDQYLELQAQLEGTENRINVARMNFNETVNEFNASIRRIPGSLIAGIGNFQRKAYFKADEGSDRVTRVEFSDKSSESEAAE